MPFLPGQVAACDPPADPSAAAAVLGGFLAALHTPAPPHAPANPYRGVALADRGEAVAACMVQLDGVVDRDAVTRVWQAALAVPPWEAPQLWLHGDLHPANILGDHSRVSGVIDFGDLTSGDPATDLSVAWMLLPVETHDAFRHAYAAADDDTWATAPGWALALGPPLVLVRHAMPVAAIGHATCRTLAVRAVL